MVKLIKENGRLAVSGALDGDGAAALVKELPENGYAVLDFNDVGSVNFAAQRKLLNAVRAGKRIRIINASDSVCRKFEDTGLTSLLDVFRKPDPVDMSGYAESGAGFLAKSYDSKDGDSVLKYFSDQVSEEMAYQEKAMAKAVMLSGIPTPLVGTIYDDGGHLTLDFERIAGKRSLSRIISEEPDRLEEITVKFARLCRQLHSTPCDTSVFPDRIEFYRRTVLGCKAFSGEDKAKVLEFIDSIPKANTCLHGDMQPSNVILTPEGEYLWIDLGDFSYGYPMLDMGMWHFLAKYNPEKISWHVFHMGMDRMALIWDVFFREYFAPESPEQAAAIMDEIEMYTALHMIHLGSTFHFDDTMKSLIKAKFGIEIK